MSSVSGSRALLCHRPDRLDLRGAGNLEEAAHRIGVAGHPGAKTRQRKVTGSGG